MFSTVICRGNSGFFNSCARRRASSRHAATRSACTRRSRCATSSPVMRLNARASCADLVGGRDIHGRAPIARGDASRAVRQPAHGTRHARRRPPAQHDAEQNPGAHATIDAGAQQRVLQLHQVAARAGDQQHAQHAVVVARQRHGVEGLRSRARPSARRSRAAADCTCSISGRSTPAPAAGPLRRSVPPA